MDDRAFWERVDSAFIGAENLEDGLQRLNGGLDDLPPKELVEFHAALDRAMLRAYNNDLRAAACFVGLGNSDDGFEDFRAWLIAQGREIYEAVLGDPEVLSSLPFQQEPIEEWTFESLHLLSIPETIEAEYDDRDVHFVPDHAISGEPVPFRKDSLRRRFPRLWERFGDCFMYGVED